MLKREKMRILFFLEREKKIKIEIVAPSAKKRERERKGRERDSCIFKKSVSSSFNQILRNSRGGEKKKERRKKKFSKIDSNSGLGPTHAQL